MAYTEITSIAAVHGTLNTLFTAITHKLVLSSKRVQVAQLTKAMNQMSDAQLNEIGVSRSEITDYAMMTININD